MYIHRRNLRKGAVVFAVLSGMTAGVFFARSPLATAPGSSGGSTSPNGVAVTHGDSDISEEKVDRRSTPSSSLLLAGREYRSPSLHKVVIYGPTDVADFPGLRPLMFGPGYTVGALEEEISEEPGRIEVRDDMNIVRLKKAPFDTTLGDPNIPSEWKRPPLSANEGSLYIVQAPGPINDTWLQDIRDRGIQPILYLPENSYIVLARESAIQDLTSSVEMPPVQFSGNYHPYYAIDDSLMDAEGTTDVAFLVPVSEEGAKALKHIALAAGKEPDVVRVGSVDVAVAHMDAALAKDIATHNAVLSAEVLPKARLFDEKSAQWMAGFRTPDRSDASSAGYLSWYSSKGFGGPPGFAIAVADSGLTQGGMIDSGTVHPDLLGPSGQSRVVAAKNYTSDPNLADTIGHGTAVAGIVAGRNTSSGSNYEDVNGFNYGVGVDPEANLVVSKVFGRNGGIATSYILGTGPADEYRAGARVTNGSWGSALPSPDYDIMSFLFDAYTLDVLEDPGRQQMTFVFAAGNDGPASASIGSPANAKNVIAVGSNENARPGWIDECDLNLGHNTTPNTAADNMNDILVFSARGPTLDGRIKPDVLAPGIHVTSHRVSNGEPCSGSPLPTGFSGYTSATGTSFSAPHVSGEISLVRRWFAKNGWKPPSPAMAKAYVVTGATYLTGTSGGGNLPNNTQGFGAATFDRLFTDTTIPLVDQSYVFTQTGQTYQTTLEVADPAYPVVVTLAYSDAPGNTVGASYVNDLDLEVAVGARLYRGNVTSGQYSIEGGSSDSRNNVERVMLPPGQSGPITVRVRAKNIAGNGVPNNVDPTDQDFAIAASNISSTNLLALERVEWTDGGNFNGRLGNPEPFEIKAFVRNFGRGTDSSVSGTISVTSPKATLTVASASFGNIPAGSLGSNTLPFAGIYEGNCTEDLEIVLSVLVASKSFEYRFTIPTDPYPGRVSKNFDIGINDGQFIEAGLDVSGGGSVLDVDVSVALEHVRVGDLIVAVRAPSGSEIVLSNRRGGANQFLSVGFDDAAKSPIAAADEVVGVVVGTFRPDGALGGFVGQQAQGTWVVRVYDTLADGGVTEGRFLHASIRVITGCDHPACIARPTFPASTSYLAEGATAGGFDSWVLVANPGTTKVLSCLTFLTDTGSRPGPLVSLEPQSRKSIRVDDWVQTYDVATVVEGIGGPVLAERAMYSSQPRLEGAHAVKAISTTSNEWFLPEGATAGPFETWVLVANPSLTATASVSVTFLTSVGPVTGPSFSLPPGVRRSVRVDDTLDAYDVATLVTSTGATVVAERSTYISPSSPGEKRGATASPGVTNAATKWYLAEGATAGGFENWILLANPSSSNTVNATVRFLTESGAVASLPVSLPPRTRRSMKTNDYATSFHLSAIVESSGDGVVVERTMYSNHPSLGQGAASGEGVAAAGSQWVAVEGATAGNFETWILVANPDSSNSVRVQVDFMSTGGVAASTTVDVPPLSRRSIKADDFVDSFDVSTRVSVVGSGSIIVERSTYLLRGPSADATASPAFRIA